MNKVKETTFFDRIRNAWQAFQGKPVKSIQLGIDVKRCSVCRRGGHWVEADLGPSLNIKCSVCGSPAEYRTTYCPDCGAKMEEGNG